MTHLMHRVSEKRGQRVSFADSLLFVSPQQLIKLRLLLVLGQHLETVVMVTDILLVDPEHRQQHVEDVFRAAKNTDNDALRRD